MNSESENSNQKQYQKQYQNKNQKRNQKKRQMNKKNEKNTQLPLERTYTNPTGARSRPRFTSIVHNIHAGISEVFSFAHKPYRRSRQNTNPVQSAVLAIYPTVSVQELGQDVSDCGEALMDKEMMPRLASLSVPNVPSASASFYFQDSLPGSLGGSLASHNPTPTSSKGGPASAVISDSIFSSNSSSSIVDHFLDVTPDYLRSSFELSLESHQHALVTATSKPQKPIILQERPISNAMLHPRRF